MKRPVSLQFSLFRNLAAGPILLGLTLFAISLFTNHHVRKTFAAELTGRIIAKTETAFVEYLRPVQEIMDLSLHLGSEGRFESLQPGDLDAPMTALLETVHQVSSIHVANSSGESYMLLRNADGSYYNRLYSPSNPGVILTREWPGRPEAGHAPRTAETSSDYDPRQRGWFREALVSLESNAPPADDSEPVWSDPYVFFTTKDPGITASIAYQTSSGRVQVLAFDILLSDILEFARASRPQGSGLVFILLHHPNASDLDVLALPSEQLTGAQKLSATDFPLDASMLEGPARAFVDASFGDGSHEEGRPIRLRANGVKWWGATALSPLSDEIEIWIVSMVPESQMLEGIPNASLIILAVLVIVIVLMVLRARRLARRYGAPIGELVSQTERMARLNFTRETTIESPIHEVQTLASSQDAMRRSLEALSRMNDRDEIARELRALPATVRSQHAGRWTISLRDQPAEAGGGLLPMLFSAERRSDGAWAQSSRADPAGAVMMLCATHLSGMRAAQQASALHATGRTLLRASCQPETLLDTVRTELTEGASTTAPVALLAAFLDGLDDTLEFVTNDRFAILHYQAASGTSHWLGQEQFAPSGTTFNHHRIDLKPGDRVVVAAEAVFDVLNSDRERLPPSLLESALAEAASPTADEIADKLMRSIREFVGSDSIEVDLALFVVSS